MPARVTAKQALHVAGQPNRGRIALTLFRDKVHGLKGSDTVTIGTGLLGSNIVGIATQAS
jgi:hypothetical protein